MSIQTDDFDIPPNQRVMSAAPASPKEEAIERALEAEVPCADILNLAASVRGATNGLVIELLEDHLQNHVVNVESDAERTTGATELIEVMRRHLK